MLEIYGAALLAEEMEQVARYLPGDPHQARDANRIVAAARELAREMGDEQAKLVAEGATA